MLVTKEYIVFLVGRNGEFDQLVASTIRRCKRAVRCDNSELVLILPYITAEYKENADAFHEYYDAVEICEASSGKHYKAAYKARNDSMADRSDLIVFCVQRPYGGAYQTMRYASRVGAASSICLSKIDHRGSISRMLPRKNKEIGQDLLADVKGTGAATFLSLHPSLWEMYVSPFQSRQRNWCL